MSDDIKSFNFGELKKAPPKSREALEEVLKTKNPIVSDKQNNNEEKNIDIQNNKKKILLIDDEPSFTSSLSRLLKTKGFEPFTLNNPELAMPAILKIKPDLIMLDLKMPKVSGDQIAAKISTNAETKNIPIIMLSGLISSNPEFKKEQKGNRSYIAKTADPNEWVKEINRLLDINRS